MFCSECGQQNEVDAKFCTNCGKKFLSATKAPSSSTKQSSSAKPSAPSPASAYVHTELKDSGTVTAMSVIGFVFGLIGMMGSFIPCIGSLAFYIGIPAALISAIALGIAYSENAKKTFAVVAVTISLIGVVISGWQYFSIVSAGKNAERELKKMFNQEQQRNERARQAQQEAKREQARLAEKKAQEKEADRKRRETLTLPVRSTAAPLGQVECLDDPEVRIYRFVVTTAGVTRELLKVKTESSNTWSTPINEEHEVIWFDELVEKPGYFRGAKSSGDRKIMLKSDRQGRIELYCSRDRVTNTDADYLEVTFKLLEKAIDSWRSKYPDLARW